ncbi:MAG: carbohydrate kinase family protein [Thermoplasmatota archaeon]
MSSVTVLGTVAVDEIGSVDRLPERNEAVRVRELAVAFGGAAGNVAVGLARLRRPPRLVACTGEEFVTSGYERALRSMGVDLRDIVRTKRSGSRAFLFGDPGGQQAIYFYPGAETMARARPKASKIVHGSAGDIAHYLPHFRKGAFVSFDPGQEIFHRPLREITSLFPETHLLFLNEHERARLSRSGWPLRRILRGRLETVVETMGPRGQTIHTARGRVHVPAPGAKAVDTTGAGDAHRAGVLWALERGIGIVDACRVGSVIAAFAVEKKGAQAGLPAPAAVKKRYLSVYGAWPF